MWIKIEKTTSKRVCLVTLWYYGLHLSFVWLPDTHLYSNPLYSSNVYFSVNCITKPAVLQNLLKTKASKHHGTTFHKNIDFIGTAPILQHSCPIVFSMIFALRTKTNYNLLFSRFPSHCILYSKRNIFHQRNMPPWPEPKLDYATLKP